MAKHVIKMRIFIVMFLGIGLLIDAGCRRPDRDVSSSASLNFLSFTGSVWRTKIELAVTQRKNYHGTLVSYLEVPPQKHSDNDRSIPHVALLVPAGARLRIDRLMQDSGTWGGLWVTAVLDEGTPKQKTVEVDPLLLAKNKFIWIGTSSSTNWDVNPDVLEKVAAP